VTKREIDDYLDRDQRDAVEARLAHGGTGVTVGPPGTGKTTEADAEAALAWYDRKECTLMCALGNDTVNEMASSFAKILGEHEAKEIAVRHGNENAIPSDLPINFERNWGRIHKYPIILTTLHSCKWLPPDLNVDRIIIDETGVETLEQALMAVPYGIRNSTRSLNYDPRYDLVDLFNDLGITMTNIGDPYQAQPISPRPHDYSAIEFFMRRCGFKTLKTTYRLPDPLDKVVDQLVGYGGLTSSPSAKNRRLVWSRTPSYPFREILKPEPPITFVNVRGEERRHGLSSWANPVEAKAVAKIILEARSSLAGHSITSITRYTGQRFEVDRCLRALGTLNHETKTTTQALGTECDLDIVSLTRNNREHELGAIGALQDLNVAISRARRKLVIVGNFEMLQDGWIWLPSFGGPGRTSRSRDLARLIERHGELIEVPQILCE